MDTKTFTLSTVLIFLGLIKTITPQTYGGSRIKDGTIRIQKLNGFRAAEAGNVLIYYAGRWGSICDDGWTLQNAHVACRMLGYPRAIGHTKQAYFGVPSEGMCGLYNIQLHVSEI